MAIPQITQTLTTFPPPPSSGGDSPAQFNAKCDAFVDHQATLYLPEITVWTTEVNTLIDAMNLSVGLLDTKVSKSSDGKAAMIPSTHSDIDAPESGMLRFNDDKVLMEYYDGTQWVLLNFNSGVASNSIGRIDSTVRRDYILVGTQGVGYYYPVFGKFDSTLRIELSEVNLEIGDIVLVSEVSTDIPIIKIVKNSTTNLGVYVLKNDSTYQAIGGYNSDSPIPSFHITVVTKNGQVFVHFNGTYITEVVSPFVTSLDIIHGSTIPTEAGFRLWTFALTDEEIGTL